MTLTRWEAEGVAVTVSSFMVVRTSDKVNTDLHMKAFAFLLVLALVACRSTVEPPPAFTAAGYYRLLTIDGQPLPVTNITAGGLTITGDSAWTVGDTSSGLVPGTFRWGGIVRTTATGFVFKDSTEATTRYTGSVSGGMFTLISTRSYQYQRVP